MSFRDALLLTFFEHIMILIDGPNILKLIILLMKQLIPIHLNILVDDSTVCAKNNFLSWLTSWMNHDICKVVKWLRINRLYIIISDSFPKLVTICFQTDFHSFVSYGTTHKHSHWKSFPEILVDSRLHFIPLNRDVRAKQAVM